jgi:hypothetical protein
MMSNILPALTNNPDKQIHRPAEDVWAVDVHVNASDKVLQLQLRATASRAIMHSKAESTPSIGKPKTPYPMVVFDS